MCNSKNSACFEFLRDYFLDETVISDIDVCGGFVNEDDFTVFEEGPTNA